MFFKEHQIGDGIHANLFPPIVYFDSKRVEYRHYFHVVKDGRNGFGENYIRYKSAYAGAPQYNARVSFQFLDDTRETLVWEPAHFKDKPFLDACHSGGLEAGTGYYGERDVIGGETPLSPKQCLLLIGRNAGWTDQQVPVEASLPAASFPMSGWLLSAYAALPLTIPAGARVLRIFDAQGRLYLEQPLQGGHMETELPKGLPAVPLRYPWMAGPQ